MILALGLAFAGRNNLGISYSLWSVSAQDEVSVKEVEEQVGKLVVEPLYNSFTKSRPHMFMTKCYSRLVFTLQGQSPGTEGYNSLTFTRNKAVEGEILFSRCGAPHHICTFKLDLQTKEVKVRESLLSGWMSVDGFGKKIESSEEEF